jgi:hypothetical protein
MMQSSNQAAESGKQVPAVEDKRAAFQAWLQPKDRIIHDLAVKMLKTRYTPERSNAWIAWQKSLTPSA